MDYQKHYNLLIERAKTRILPSDIYTERHHIIPKSMGGSDSTENLVRLKADEHFLAHLLLVKIYKDHELQNKLVFAAHMMTVGTKGQKRNNNKQYSWLRKKMCSQKTPQHRANIGVALKGKPKSEKHKNNLSKGKKGKKRSKESCEKQSATMTGTKRGVRGDTHRANLSKSLKGRKIWNTGTKGLQKAWNKGIPRTEEDKQKVRDGIRKSSGQGVWMLSPDGEVVLFSPIKQSAKNNGISPSRLNKHRKDPNYYCNGWKFIRIAVLEEILQNMYLLDNNTTIGE